jgi:hypothetical protein
MQGQNVVLMMVVVLVVMIMIIMMIMMRIVCVILLRRRKGSDRDFVDSCEHALQLCAIPRHNHLKIVTLCNSFQEAVDAEHDCSEAVYNSAIINRHLGRLPEARGLLQKFLKLVPGSPDAMFQLAQVCDSIRDSMPKDKLSVAQQQQLDALAHESSRLYVDDFVSVLV